MYAVAHNIPWLNRNCCSGSCSIASQGHKIIHKDLKISQLMSNLCLIVALPSIICVFWPNVRHWPETITVLLWVQAAQVTFACFRPLGKAPGSFMNPKVQRKVWGTWKRLTGWWHHDAGTVLGLSAAHLGRVRLWVSVKCLETTLIATDGVQNKIELRMPTQCIFCPGLMGSGAIFLNSRSCVCSLTCPAVKANCSHKQKSFYIQMEPLPLSISTLSAQPWLSCTFFCSPVFVLLHIYHYCG